MSNVRHQRREAKAARRRHRQTTGKSRRRITAPQEAARAWYGDQNLRALTKRAGIVAENRRREADGKKPKRLPLLTHFRGRIPVRLLEDLGLVA